MADSQSSTSAIYAIQHIATKKVYIGSSVKVNLRWINHRKSLAKGDHHSPRLQNAWNKYGADAFAFIVLEHVSDPRNLIEREQWHIDRIKSYDPRYGYNIYPTAGSRLGFHASEETKAKLSAFNRGKKRSEETRRRMAVSHQGIKPTPETRAKLSANNRKGMKGKTHSPEAREKMSLAKKGKTKTAEHRAKIAATNTGKTHSAETRAKLSALSMNHKLSAESRAKISAAKKGKAGIHGFQGCRHSSETKARIGSATRERHATRRLHKNALSKEVQGTLFE